MLGMGGGGGAPALGMGGAGGGAPAKAPAKADPEGIGGGGGAPPLSIEGADGVEGLSIGVLDLSFSSIAERGRGGAMVPNRMEARCLALPPVGWSVSSSELSVESTTDHSSSSGRTREGRWPLVGADESGWGNAGWLCGWEAVLDAADSCWVRRWKGFVEISAAVAEARDDEGCALDAKSVGWLSFLKKGFLLSLYDEF